MKRLFKPIGVAIAIAMFAFFLVAPQHAQAAYWKQKFVRFSATAGETVATGQAVYLKGSDQKVYLADGATATEYPVVGIIGKGGAANATVEVVVTGLLVDAVAVSDIAHPGQRVYLRAHPGGISVNKEAGVLAYQRQMIGYIIPDKDGTPTSRDAFIDVQQAPAHESWY